MFPCLSPGVLWGPTRRGTAGQGTGNREEGEVEEEEDGGGGEACGEEQQFYRSLLPVCGGESVGSLASDWTRGQ